MHDARRKVSGGGRNRAAVVSLTCRSKFPRQAARAAETRVGWRETFEVFCGARRGSIKQRTCFTFIKPSGDLGAGVFLVTSGRRSESTVAPARTSRRDPHAQVRSATSRPSRASATRARRFGRARVSSRVAPRPARWKISRRGAINEPISSRVNPPPLTVIVPRVLDSPGLHPPREAARSEMAAMASASGVNGASPSVPRLPLPPALRRQLPKEKKRSELFLTETPPPSLLPSLFLARASSLPRVQARSAERRSRARETLLRRAPRRPGAHRRSRRPLGKEDEGGTQAKQG